MKINVGDYVRTDKGNISKIKYISQQTTNSNETKSGIFYLENDEIVHMYYGDTIKSSPNIIDLIEADDLIKIIYLIVKDKDLFQEEVIQVIENKNNKLYIKLYTGRYVFLEDLSKYDIDVKSIITKEQFSEMEHKINE